MKTAYHKCPICKEYPSIGELAYDKSHRCPPKWLCRFNWDKPEYERVIYAGDVEKAAEKFVEKYDDEYVGYSDFSTVYVYSELTGAGVMVEVQGELVRSYHAREKGAIETHPDYAEEVSDAV